ncbi:hypothetical protein LJB92_00035 [Bacteroidales bacterium OttesenSCG-928-M06]|nr:hypothetical protein [Bacteroidales bacterium OttesenSCG-928-M06]
MKAKHGLIFVWGIVFLATLGAVIMLLWNWLLPSLLGVAAINFWQALGLFILARILFGGFGIGHKMMMARNMKNRHRNPIHEKWMKMSDEERKEFIRKRKQFGFGGSWGREDFCRHSDFDISGHKEASREE